MSGSVQATATEDESNGACPQATGTRAGRNLEATIEVSSWDTRAVAGGPLKSARAQAGALSARREVTRAPSPHSLKAVLHNANS